MLARYKLAEARLRRLWEDSLRRFRTDDRRVLLSELITRVLRDRAVAGPID